MKKQATGHMKHEGEELVGRTAIISQDNDNDNYDDYRGKELIITSASNEGRGYDSALYPEMLCDFRLKGGGEFPFALYEYEFDLID